MFFNETLRLQSFFSFDFVLLFNLFKNCLCVFINVYKFINHVTIICKNSSGYYYLLYSV